jgi:tetratricopeptide (TPR) repeat protein
MNDSQQSSRSGQSSVRLGGLILMLAICVAAYFYSRKALSAHPPEPAKSASARDKAKVYLARIQADKTDAQAYVELGKLEEGQEYYTSALRRLLAARVLGAPEQDIILPIGRSYSHLARWDLAIKELAAAARLLPDSVEAAANLAGAYFSSGDSKGASRALRDFVGTHTNPDGSTRLTQDELGRLMLCFSEARDQDGAASVATQILRIAPHDAASNAMIGQSLLLAGKYQQSLEYFRRSIASDPAVPNVRYNYAISLEKCGREAEAIPELERCAGLNEKAKEAFVELANLYEKRHKTKVAAFAMAHVAADSPKDTRVLYSAGRLHERAGMIPEANFWFAKSALSAKQYSDALKYAAKLTSSSDPRWRASGYYLSSEIFRPMHRMKDYLEAFKKSQTRDDARSDLALADAYEKADLLDLQVATLRRALAREPRIAAQVHTSIADTMVRRALPDVAEREMELAVAADPSDPASHQQLGNLYFQRRETGGRLRKAIREYQEAARLDPTDSTGFQSLGTAYSAAGDLPNAAHSLEHAIDLEPGYGPSYQELGRVYAAMGDRTSSEAMLGLFRKYVRYDLRLKTLVARADQNRNDAAAQADLADLQAKSGDLVSALDSYGIALKLAPADRQTRRKYDRILAILTQRPTRLSSAP